MTTSAPGAIDRLDAALIELLAAEPRVGVLEASAPPPLVSLATQVPAGSSPWSAPPLTPLLVQLVPPQDRS